MSRKTAKPEPKLWTVPVCWPNGTVLCIGGGPSLSEEDCFYAAPRVDGIIGVNDAYRVYPALHILYACDHKWWKWHYADVVLKAQTAIRVTGQPQAKAEFPDLNLLRIVHAAGWSVIPDSVHAGGHGGYHAINIAILAGAARIILLGYDMQPASAELAQKKGLAMGVKHWFGEHPDKTKQDFSAWLQAFTGTDAMAKRLGVHIINCTRETALQEFDRIQLEEAL